MENENDQNERKGKLITTASNKQYPICMCIQVSAANVTELEEDEYIVIKKIVCEK